MQHNGCHVCSIGKAWPFTFSLNTERFSCQKTSNREVLSRSCYYSISSTEMNKNRVVPRACCFLTEAFSLTVSWKHDLYMFPLFPFKIQITWKKSPEEVVVEIFPDIFLVNTVAFQDVWRIKYESMFFF